MLRHGVAMAGQEPMVATMNPTPPPTTQTPNRDRPFPRRELPTSASTPGSGISLKAGGENHKHAKDIITREAKTLSPNTYVVFDNPTQ